MSGYVETMANADKFKNMMNTDAQANAAKAKMYDQILAQKEQQSAAQAKAVNDAMIKRAGVLEGIQAGYDHGMQAGEQATLSKMYSAMGKRANAGIPINKNFVN